MATVNHSALQPPNNHGAFNLIYRTEADRVAGTNEVNGVTLTADNIGQLAKQLDNGYYYELLTVSPSITWRQVTGGVKQKTTTDIDIWISTTGSDTTGDGSASTPYATFTRAFREVQDLDLRHKATIHPAAGTYTDFPQFIRQTVGPGGLPVIDASHNTAPVVAGPFTVDTVTGEGPVGPFGTSLATNIKATGTPGWTANQYYGKFIRCLTGNWAGHLLPVWSNTTDTIRTYYDWQTWAPGDTFEIVSAPVIVDIDHEIQVIGETSGEVLYGSFNPKFLIGGVEFQIDTGDAFIPPMYFEGFSLIFSFVNLIDVYDTDSDSIPLVVRDGSFNFALAPSGSFYNDKLEVWFTYAMAILSMNGAEPTATGIDLAMIGNIAGQGAASFMCRRSVYSDSSDDSLFWVMAGGYTNLLSGQTRAISQGSSTFSHLYIEQIGYTTTALKVSSKKISVPAVYVAVCNLPMSLNDGSFAVVDWFKGGTIGNAYALEINRGSHMVIPDVTDVTIAGTTGAVKFTFDGTTHAAWPTSGNFHSKVNSYVVSE
jgi:hypothetical protein